MCFASYLSRFCALHLSLSSSPEAFEAFAVTFSAAYTRSTSLLRRLLSLARPLQQVLLLRNDLHLSAFATSLPLPRLSKILLKSNHALFRPPPKRQACAASLPPPLSLALVRTTRPHDRNGPLGARIYGVSSFDGGLQRLDDVELDGD